MLILTVCLSAGCGGAGGSESAAEGTTPAGTDERKPTATVYSETRTVSLYDPYMQNAPSAYHRLSARLANWWERWIWKTSSRLTALPTPKSKGATGVRQLGFYTEMARSYYDENDGVATGQRHPPAAQHEAALHHCRGLSAICGKDTVSPCTVHRTEGRADLRKTAGRDETIR